MTAPERVNTFLTQNSSAVCADCIAQELAFASRSPTTVITAALATTKEFIRGLGRCALCRREKMVTRRC